LYKLTDQRRDERNESYIRGMYRKSIVALTLGLAGLTAVVSGSGCMSQGSKVNEGYEYRKEGQYEYLYKDGELIGIRDGKMISAPSGKLEIGYTKKGEENTLRQRLG